MLTKPDYTETELVTLLKRKDHAAYNYLYDNYSSALFGIIYKVVGRREEATDILQDIFVKIWRNIDSYDSAKGRLISWMINIARNTAIDFLRSGQSQRERKTNSMEIGFNSGADNLVTHMRTDHVGLNDVVSKLKAEHKIVIDLAYFQGFTQEEIARELNLPLGTVKTRARSALIHLKNILK